MTLLVIEFLIATIIRTSIIHRCVLRVSHFLSLEAENKLLDIHKMLIRFYPLFCKIILSIIVKHY